MKNWRNYKLFSVFLVVILLVQVCFSQEKENDFLEKSVKDVKYQQTDIHLALSDLADKYKIAIGLERVVRGSEANEVSKEIEVSIENGTVRNVLDAIMESDGRYQWQINDGVVNVYPKLYQESILDVTVESFSYDSKKTMSFGESISKTPEVKAKTRSMGIRFFEMSFGGLVGKGGVLCCKDSSVFSFEIQNATVRKILNEAIRKKGSHYWVVSRLGKNNVLLNISL